MESLQPLRPRIVLLADGKSKEAHLDNSRLLTRIGGQRLIVRTVHQFSEWADVCVVTSDPQIREALAAQRHTSFQPAGDHQYYEGVNMIHEGLSFAYGKRSILVFGDVYFTDEAVAKIRDNVVDGWAVYGRSTDNKLTGTPYAEFFAIEVGWGTRQLAREAMLRAYHTYRRGQWHRITPWEWYYEMEGMNYRINDPTNVPTGPHWVEINDLTDDIDMAIDIERMEKAVGEAKKMA